MAIPESYFQKTYAYSSSFVAPFPIFFLFCLLLSFLFFFFFYLRPVISMKTTNSRWIKNSNRSHCVSSENFNERLNSFSLAFLLPRAVLFFSFGWNIARRPRDTNTIVNHDVGKRILQSLTGVWTESKIFDERPSLFRFIHFPLMAHSREVHRYLDDSRETERDILIEMF